MKVRMGVEKEKQCVRDVWWARQDDDVRTEINDIRKKRMLHLMLSSNAERSQNTEAETHLRIPSSEGLGHSVSAVAEWEKNQKENSVS